MAISSFPVLDVSGWQVVDEEAIGLDEKEWLRDPKTEQAWLFKPVTEHATWVQGEDWSEKLASELGRLLGVPCARVELARRRGRRGAVSLNLRPERWEMHTGAVVLSGIVPEYRSAARGRPGHSLPNIRRVLDGASPPPAAEVPEEFTAFDVFAGYMVFDAWIANRDRHDQNWALLRPPPSKGADALCGSYDHATSLGFNLLDTKRVRIIQDDAIEVWARRGTAWRFEHGPSSRPPTLVALAADALALASAGSREYWLTRLASVTCENVTEIVDRVPGLSEPCRTFVVRLLRTNQRRVLDEC